MKAILYIGALLMIAATVYGFVDHKKASNKKEFRGMYESKERSNEASSELPVKPNVTLPEPRKVELIEEKEVPDTEVEKTGAAPIKSKRKKIDAELFSRAPLKEQQEPTKVKVSSKRTPEAVKEEKQ